MKNINYIIIHSAATPEGREHSLKDINLWHKQRGFKDNKGDKMFCGYHFVIQLDGSIEIGRPLTRSGAHTTGKNSKSVGICYIGGCDKQMKAKDTRTELQKTALENRVKQLLYDYPNAKVAGHSNFANKACPSFNVKEWCKEIGLMDINIY